MTGKSADGSDGAHGIRTGSPHKSFIPSTNSPLAKSLSKTNTNEPTVNREGASHVKKRLVYEKEVHQSFNYSDFFLLKNTYFTFRMTTYRPTVF